MQEMENIKKKFGEAKICVIIPTYNNAQTLLQVIDDVSTYCNDIIVVNDGSTDHTVQLLKSRPQIDAVHQPSNSGKGLALRKGFHYAIQQGFDYAISIDSDGQHFGKDLPKFLDKLSEVGEAVIIGARNMEQSSVPGKSSFGNKFSNFWFKVETGINSPDTQSGYRLYPLKQISKMNFFTRKYEFEIEVLVRLAWKGIPVTAVPVQVYYAPSETRVSHFRPFKDFTRISILNTVLVILTFLYIKPAQFLSTLFNRKKIWNFINSNIIHSGHSDEKKALSIAFGVFMGIIPIWGFQLVAAIFLAILFRLDKALVIIAANISIPPMIPLILFLSFQAGTFWMGADAVELLWNEGITYESMRLNLQQYIYGSISLAFIAAFLFGATSYILIKTYKRRSAFAR